jgi:flagellin
MTVINTNTAAILTANALTKNERAMNQTMERLSTGQRINSAADDAAGLAISSKMTSQINGLNMAVRNANDAISMVQTADGALIEVSNMLQRMRELAVQAASATNTDTDRDSLDLEFEALTDEIDRIGETTQWNGTLILDGSLGAITFQVGANANQTIGTQFGSVDTDTGEGVAFGLFNGLDTVGLGNGTDNTAGALNVESLQSVDLATAAITRVDNAIANLNEHRASLGAVINRLEYAADNLSNVSQNASASRSRILDADYASETTELARTQIIQQAGTAMLSQANQQAQSVLALLK